MQHTTRQMFLQEPRLYLVKPNDTDTIQACIELLNKNYGTNSHYSKWIENGFRPFPFDYMLGQVTNPQRSLWVLKRSSKDIVAMIIMQKNNDHVLFHKFCALHGYGYGSKLFKKVEQKAKHHGFTNMRVEVFTPAFKLVNYYMQKGYTHVISYKQLEESEFVKYKCQTHDYGFIMLEKRL